ncbi:MAG: TatD family hydrolase [Gammaproteobacteria bacterium]|nr:TatD family hydrolase [Gammaproteobacteria bacterium]
MPEALVDIGVNLTHDSFDADREDVIRRAQEAGVTRFIVTGATEQGSRDALALARRYPGIMYCTAGVHPHHAADYDADVHRTLVELLNDDTVVAVGECGLDYFRNFSPREAQLAAFEDQLGLAAATGKPLFLHQRDAHDDFVALLRPNLGQISRAVAHCFTGDEAMLEEYLDMGLYIGVTGWICDERRGLELQRIAGSIPLDRLLIETDAPYLLPRSLEPRPGSRRNEPAYLVEVLRVIAKCSGRPAAEIARATTANALRFFGIGT